MFKLVFGAIFTLVVAFSGPAVWWWDRRPAGEPVWLHFHVLAWTWPGPSLGAQLAADEKAKAVWADDLTVCQDNEHDLKDALDAQSASVTALHADSDRMLAQTQQRLQAANSAALAAQSERDALLAKPPAGADVCARYEDVHQRFTEQLR